jgi:alkylated DNA nucleotide flippase Atl1
VFADRALVGFVELKAPGRGVDTTLYKGHDHQQWERLACLPNVLYSDGQEVDGNVLLLSQVLIPLPEAKDFEGRSTAKRQLNQQRKTSKRLTPEQRDAVKTFIDAIPTGQWTSYKDVAIAATGNPLGAMGIGSHLNARGGADLPNVYRVLNRHGQVSDGWNTTTPGLPSTPGEVRDRLIGEGVEFTADRASEAQRFTPEDWLAARAE